MSSPHSPKRGKTLSSITPLADRSDGRPLRDHRHAASRSPPPRDEDPPVPHTREADVASGAADTEPPRVARFRFKSHSSSHRRSRRRERSGTLHEDHEEATGDATGHQRHRHHDDPSRPRRHHRRRHRRHRTRSPSPAPRPAQDHDPFAVPLDPDVAFRESLFDAMADDEGAAYWESVYGQPIHIYQATRAGPRGELERMTDEEYAAHVRQKMWEKTHAGLIEERARREREREARRKRDEEAAAIAAEMERSLRRGDERRKRRGWRERWEAYARRWAEWRGTDVEGIPWPVTERGGEKEREEAVRAFFVNGLRLEEVGEREFAARLKEERVRWHPDKMQQRLGGQMDVEVMREVTATFQVIDRLWNDTRGK